MIKNSKNVYMGGIAFDMCVYSTRNLSYVNLLKFKLLRINLSLALYFILFLASSSIYIDGFLRNFLSGEPIIPGRVIFLYLLSYSY